jgi:hypothetical protein
MPVPRNTLVDVIFRDRTVAMELHAGNAEAGPGRPYCALDWRHTEDSLDIIAYRESPKRPEQWLAWDGDATPPYPAGAKVDILRRDGKEFYGVYVGSKGLDWTHQPSHLDIVAFRLHQEGVKRVNLSSPPANLFRAWDERRRVLHYNFQSISSGSQGNDWVVFTSKRNTLSSERHPFDNPHFAQQLIIMENTFAVDSFGTEVYQGDLIAMPSPDPENPRIYKVYLDRTLQHSGRVVLRPFPSTGEYSAIYLADLVGSEDKFMVIGFSATSE